MAEVNFMMAMINAVDRSQMSLSGMQAIDGQSTIAAAEVEKEISDEWNGPNGTLAQDAKAVANAKSDNDRAAAQAKFQEDSARAQSEISTGDGLTQQEQNLSSMDSSNLQKIVECATAVNSIGSTLASALAS